MSNLFFPGMPDLGERIRNSAHVLIGLDYDGTLTAIVDEPADALMPISMREVVRALAQRQNVSVAVISGRAQGDLRNLVAIPGVIYAGNHGMEISGPGISFIEPDAQAAVPALHVLAQEIESRLRHIEGAVVEDKGLTLSIHHRRVAPVEGEKVWQTVQEIVAPHQDRFHVTLGDKVYEIRPHLRWHKGSAIAWIKAHIGDPDTLVIYIGDDTTDEDAFRALGDGAITIRVGDDAQTAARFLLPDPATVQRFLLWVDELRTSEPVHA